MFIITKNVCGFTYYLGYSNQWEGLIDNANQMDNETVKAVVDKYFRKDLAVSIKLYNNRKKQIRLN